MPIFPGPFPAFDEDFDPTLGSYAAQLQKLLPPGVLWDLEQGSLLRETLVAMADELERVRDRGRDVIRESDPRYASETLDQWETMLGLPDERVLTIPNTVEERRVVVTAKYVAQGGQSFEYFEILFAACGWPLLEIIKGPPQVLRVGARVNDRVYGDAWAYSIEFVIDEPLDGAMNAADFERLVRHVTHSHITPNFSYT